MPQISTGDFRKGIKVIVEGEPYEMFEVNFVKPGKGQALYKTKLRNLLKGTILDRTYKSGGESLEQADIRKGDGQFLYKDANGLHFMDNETFEQYSIGEEVSGDAANYLLDGAICSLLFWNDQLIGMDPPQQVIVEVTYTEPAAKGNTATNVTKPATIETGATVNVPAFINVGEKIKVDTATGSYVERIRE